MAAEPESKADPNGPSENARTAISLVLFVHLFCVFLSLSAFLSRSRVQDQLLRFFRPYVETLNLSMRFTPPYFLSHGDLTDVDHRIEVLPEGADATRNESWLAPERGWRGGERLRRYQRLGVVLGFLSERDDPAALVAGDVASRMIAEGQKVQQIRCRQHMLQYWERVSNGTAAERNPNDASYFRVPYLADVGEAKGGKATISKTSTERRDVASPTRPGASGAQP